MKEREIELERKIESINKKAFRKKEEKEIKKTKY